MFILLAALIIILNLSVFYFTNKEHFVSPYQPDNSFQEIQISNTDDMINSLNSA
jgi:hypothetical protein